MLAVLTRFYQRHPGRYLYVTVICIAVQTEIAVGVTALIVGRHFTGLTWHQTFLAMALIQPVPVACFGAALYTIRHELALISRWILRQDPRPAPQEVADAVERDRRVTAIATGSCAVLAAPLVPTVLALVGGHASVLRIVTAAIGGVFGVTYAGLSVVLTQDVVVRPLLADL